MRNLIALLILSLFMWGCSSSDQITDNMTPEQKLNLAIKNYNDEDYLEAVQEFQSIILNYPADPVVDDAQYYLAESRFQRGEYIMAAYEFSKLIKTMPASKFVPVAQYMLADCYYELSPDYRLDQQYTKKAIKEFQAFIDFFPSNEKVKDAEKKISELNNKLGHKSYETAVLYEKMDDYKAALFYYTNTIENYHETKYASLAMYDKIMLLNERDRDLEALTEIEKFLDRYPDNPNIKEIEDLKSKLQTKLSSNN